MLFASIDDRFDVNSLFSGLNSVGLFLIELNVFKGFHTINQ